MWVNLAETNTPKKALNLTALFHHLSIPLGQTAKYGARTRAAA